PWTALPKGPGRHGFSETRSACGPSCVLRGSPARRGHFVREAAYWVSRAEVPAPACSLLLDLGSFSLRGLEDRCSFLASGGGMRRGQTQAGSGAPGRRARARCSPEFGISPASIAPMMCCTTCRETRAGEVACWPACELVDGSAGHARRAREFRCLGGLRAGDDLE